VGSDACQGLAADGSFVLPLRFLFDFSDQIPDVLTHDTGIDMAPAGQGFESKDLFRSEVSRPVGLATLPGGKLSGAVEPEASKRRVVEKGVRAVGAGPVER
jgi:hypothetical protein